MSEEVRVTIEYRDLKHEVHGNTDSVIREVVKFLASVVPTYSVASKLTYTPDYVQLAEDLSHMVKIGHDGGILSDTSDLPAEQAVGILLLGADLAHRLSKRLSNEMTVDEMATSSGRPMKTIRNSMVELTRKGLAERTGRGSYRITVAGTKRVHDSLKAQSPPTGGVSSS